MGSQHDGEVVLASRFRGVGFVEGCCSKYTLKNDVDCCAFGIWMAVFSVKDNIFPRTHFSSGSGISNVFKVLGAR